MRPCQYDVIFLQRTMAVMMQLPVGQHIKFVALRLQPGQQVVIGGVVTQTRRTQVLVRIGDIADANVQHRAVPGCEADARTIRVVVVRRPPVLRMIAGVVRIAVPRLGASLPSCPPGGSVNHSKRALF